MNSQRKEIQNNPWVKMALEVTKNKSSSQTQKKEITKSPTIQTKKNAKHNKPNTTRKHVVKQTKSNSTKSNSTKSNSTINIPLDKGEFHKLISLMMTGSKEAEQKLKKLLNKENTLKDATYFGGKVSKRKSKRNLKSRKNQKGK